MQRFTHLSLPELQETFSHRGVGLVFRGIVCASGDFMMCGGFPGGSPGKESTCNTGDLGSIPGLGGYPGEGIGYPLQHSGLENSTDYIVHGVAKSQTRLRDFHFHIENHQ